MEPAAPVQPQTQATQDHPKIRLISSAMVPPSQVHSRYVHIEHLLSMLDLPPLSDTHIPPNKPDERLPVFKCNVEIACGISVPVYAVGPYICIGIDVHPWGRNVLEVDPFVKLTPVGTAYHKTVEVEEHTHGWYGLKTKVQKKDSYGGAYDPGSSRVINSIPYNYMRFVAVVDADKISTEAFFPFVREEIEVKLKRPESGEIDLDASATIFKVSTNFYGLDLTWDEDISAGYNHNPGTQFYWSNTHRLLSGNYTVKQGRDALWARFLSFMNNERDNKGLKATLSKKGIKENVERLKTEAPLLWSYIAWLHDSRTRKGVSNNSLLTAFFEDKGTDFEALKVAITESMAFAGSPQMQTNCYDASSDTRAICLQLPGAKDKDEEKRAHKEWYLRKSNKAQAEGLGITEKDHPKLLAAIEAGHIPFNLFHKTDNKLHLINVEFDLWERALAREGWADVLFKLAQNASGRTTYDKNLTPYLAFLFRIEGYLDRHTGKGKKWRAMPAFVNSEWQLEMDEADEGGTTKRRSALTPIPDNDARIITVPYVAMRVAGARTTFCYALDYQVFEEYTVDRESGTPIVNELERKLNGRDDYGLMYYTLTGTARNQGYPTFLIIFERRKGHTHVHFHRVHPCRSKEGIPTPACRLIEECYRYMAGNIRAEEITAQQGDLIFIKTDQTVTLPTDAKRVKEFESHAFVPLEDKPILLIPNEAKSIKNRLGFIYSEGAFTVDHPEHEPLKNMPAGLYEVRRCRSYENNPTGVWSLTVD